ncbi:hypothetical protein SAMN04487969_13251, partial [Paenibacillus algorifonticola]
ENVLQAKAVAAVEQVKEAAAVIAAAELDSASSFKREKEATVLKVQPTWA